GGTGAQGGHAEDGGDETTGKKVAHAHVLTPVGGRNARTAIAAGTRWVRGAAPKGAKTWMHRPVTGTARAAPSSRRPRGGCATVCATHRTGTPRCDCCS